MRRAIEDRKFQLLGTDISTYTMADLKHLGLDSMQSVVDYVADNVNVSVLCGGNEMLTFDVKRKINTVCVTFWWSKVPDPKAQVEQITIALIYKFMDDMDIEGLEFGGTRQFFTGEYEKYAWTEIMKPENSGQQRALLYAEGIEKMTTNPNLPSCSGIFSVEHISLIGTRIP